MLHYGTFPYVILFKFFISFMTFRKKLEFERLSDLASYALKTELSKNT